MVTKITADGTRHGSEANIVESKEHDRIVQTKEIRMQYGKADVGTSSNGSSLHEMDDL
jgi:hypothetical protein